MGIAFITEKAKKYKHRRDAAFENQLATSNLLSALSESVRRTFRCQMIGHALPEIGTPVLLYRTDVIRVFHLNTLLGTVVEPDATELASIMAASAIEAIAAEVVELRSVAQQFVVEPLPARTSTE